MVPDHTPQQMLGMTIHGSYQTSKKLHITKSFLQALNGLLRSQLSCSFVNSENGGTRDIRLPKSMPAPKGKSLVIH